MIKKLIDEYKRNKNIRYVKSICKKCGENLTINGYSVVNKHTFLGNNVNFNGMTVIGNGELFIGDNFHSGEACYIITDTHNYDSGDSIPYDSKKSIARKTIIEDNVWLGVGVIILPGAFIHEGAIIQAGSVVCGTIPTCAIAGGHPAKVFKYRDIEHYYKLKQEGKFF